MQKMFAQKVGICQHPKDSNNRLNMIGTHIYPIGKNRFKFEPTFTIPNDKEFYYANCRCFKNN